MNARLRQLKQRCVIDVSSNSAFLGNRRKLFSTAANIEVERRKLEGACAPIAKEKTNTGETTFAEKIELYSALSKRNLSTLVVASAVAGYFAAGTPFSATALAGVTAGTYLSSFAANSFNQLYEIETDKKMHRTKRRPLPSERLKVSDAVKYAITCSILGPSILYFSCGTTAAVLGASNIFLYAAIYTPLKQKHVINTWVGSIVGMIPPLIGYSSALSFTHFGPDAWILASGLFLWQFPHFFALAFMNKMDYARGGHKMVPVFDKTGKVTSRLIWTHALGLSALPFIAYGLKETSVMFPLESVLFNGYFMYLAYKFHKNRSKANARKVFLASLWNLPAFMVLFLLHQKEHESKDTFVLPEWIQIQDQLSQAIEVGKNNLQEAGKLLCLHELLVFEKKEAAESKPFCLSNGEDKAVETKIEKASI